MIFVERETGDMRVYLPNSAHLANIGGYLSNLDVRDRTHLDVVIHKKWVSVHPLTLALTACMGAVCRQSRGIVRVKEIPGHRSIAYLIRMGLFDALGVDADREITEHEESGRFIPLTQIRTSEDLKRVIANLVPLLHAPANVADPIRYVVSELGRNVLEHSGSPVGAFVCAQYYARSNRIAIGIADAGVGIRETISRSHRAATDLDAIMLSLQPGITGTTSRIGGTAFNAGAGLFFTKSIAALSKNLFVLASGGVAFKLLRQKGKGLGSLNADPERDRHGELEIPGWNGTAIGIDISVEGRKEFSGLLDEIRKAYSIDIKSKKKAYYKKIQFEK